MQNQISLNDLRNESCGLPEKVFTDHYVGEGPDLVPEADIIFLASGIYELILGHYVGGKDYYVDCIGDSGTLEPINIWWGPKRGWSDPLLSIPLPSSGTVLSGTKNFTSPSAEENISTNWTASWHLSPVPDDTRDNHCKKNNASDIGCQSQSLGEDIPIVGAPFYLHYQSDRQVGWAAVDSVAAQDALYLGGWTISIHHALEPLLRQAMSCAQFASCMPYAVQPKALFLGNGDTRSDANVQRPILIKQNVALTSKDGSEVYIFDGVFGLHRQTLRPLSGDLLYQFGYDTSGRVNSVTDSSGNVTEILRDTNGHPTAIVSPYGQTTTLAVDTNGYLSQVTDPAGHSVKLVTSRTGLLSSLTDANGNISSFKYDNLGRLIKDTDAAGGDTSLARTDITSGYNVIETTALGTKTSYQTVFSSTASSTTQQSTNIWPSGLKATGSDIQQRGKLYHTTALPDGTKTTQTIGPDPRWGIQVPVATSATTSAGTLVQNQTRSRTATLSNSGDPFSLTTQTDIETINGRIYTADYAASDRTYTNTSPMGRKLTVTLDDKERIAATQVAGLLATAFTYDSHGRLATVTQGARITTLAYNREGFLSSIIDPLGREYTLTYDAAGHPLTLDLPDGASVGYAYDANGNQLRVTTPSKTVHEFAYTPVNLPSTYTPPPISGTASIKAAYNLDRQITKITRPDGTIVSFHYDPAGRLSSLVTPTSTTQYSYSSTTGNMTSASIASGEALSYGYEGSLPTSYQWQGPVGGTVNRAYNNNFWTTSLSVNGANVVDFTYDNDGLLTQAGALVVKRNSQNALITGTSLGLTGDVRMYNGFGELTAETASYNGLPVYTFVLKRDAGGRVISNTESIEGTTNIYAYTYDLAGRVKVVSKNGVKTASYTYDANSNRLTKTTSLGTIIGTYDTQDRLLTYGVTKYSYTASGELASKGIGTQTTTYKYDALGNLIGASLPNGTKISYVLDAENRWVGKKVNGLLSNGFLYDGQTVMAELNGADAIVSEFVYASGRGAPDYMVQGSNTYRIFSDQLGSPRLVVNTSTGRIVERIDYDEFGNVIKDTNPGFQPFGFGGGLYDQHTKLVHLGARDYDAGAGRWTAKDPILFGGGDTNLYGYVLNDPLNMVDPAGLEGRSAGSPDAGTSWVPEWVPDFIKDLIKDVYPEAVEGAYEKSIKGEVEPTMQKQAVKEVHQLHEGIVDPCMKEGVDPLSKKLQEPWNRANKALSGDNGNNQTPPPPPQRPTLKQFGQ